MIETNKRIEMEQRWGGGGEQVNRQAKKPSILDLIYHRNWTRLLGTTTRRLLISIREI